MKVLIADDHTIVRRGLVQILEEIDIINQIHEASDGDEAFDKFHNDSFDIVILDLSMPGLNGLELLEIIKRTNPDQKVLVLSTYSEELYALRALRSGASGYLTKSAAANELINAIKTIISGRKYISSSVADILARDISNEQDKLPHERLSKREFEVFIHIATGLKPKQIAQKLLLSEKTISTYRSRVMEKMNLKDNHSLLQYAYLHSLIDKVL